MMVMMMMMMMMIYIYIYIYMFIFIFIFSAWGYFKSNLKTFIFSKTINLACLIIARWV